MFRRRALALLIGSGLLMLAAGWVLVGTLEDRAREAAAARIGAARPGVARMLERRTLSQAFVALRVADSPLATSLDVLDEFRTDLASAARGAEAAAAGLPSRQAAEARQSFVAAFQRGGDSLAGLFAERLADALQDRLGDGAFGTGGRAAFTAAERARLVQCLSVEVSQCYWDYAYVTLMEALSATHRAWGLPAAHRVIVADSRGVGIADSRDDRWSDAQDFGASHEMVRAALATGQPRRDLMRLGGTWHLATAVPLAAGTRRAGVLVVAEPFSRWMAGDDAQALGLDVIYAAGPDLVDTSAPPDVAQALVKNPAGRRDWVAASMSLPGLPEGRDLRVLVALPLGPALAPFRAARAGMLAVGLVLVALASVLMVLSVHAFHVGVQRLYQGVHEVIHGNQAYAFPTDQKDDVLRNLGSALNLMATLAQGRPLLDEEPGARPDAWTGTDTWESVDRAVESPAPDVASLAAEPAEAYYRRLFAEFTEARRRAGIVEERVTQEAFLVRVVNLEQKLKKRYGVPMVRFTVQARGNDVVLVPRRMAPPSA